MRRWDRIFDCSKNAFFFAKFFLLPSEFRFRFDFRKFSPPLADAVVIIKSFIIPSGVSRVGVISFNVDMRARLVLNNGVVIGAVVDSSVVVSYSFAVVSDASDAA